MHSLRWGGALLSAAAVVGVAVVSIGRSAGIKPVDAAPDAGDGRASVLVGHVDAPGIDLSRYRVLCYSLRLETSKVVHEAEIDERGRFELTGLGDTDYCVEVVPRSNPALVLARSDHVRPGGEEHTMLADLARIFGPAGHASHEDR